MKSDTKNQMSTKQIPFVFFYFLFRSQDSSAVHRNLFPLCLHVHSWTGSCPCSLSHCPFLAITSQGKGVRKAASEPSPKDVPLFRSGMSVVLFWVVTLDYSRMTASREERILTKVERKQEFIRRANRAEWRGTYCVGI